jgi:hypothetical protein
MRLFYLLLDVLYEGPDEQLISLGDRGSRSRYLLFPDLFEDSVNRLQLRRRHALPQFLLPAPGSRLL